MSNEYVDRKEEILHVEEIMPGVKFERVHEHVTVRVKRCPFCGGPGHTEHVNTSDGYDLIEIKCEACGIHTKLCEDHEEATALWNKRRPPVLIGAKKGAINCPFCSGKASVLGADALDEEHEDMYRVECERCEAATEYYTDWKESVKRWNRRA